MSKSSQEKLSYETADDKKEHKLLRKGLAVALAGAVTLGAAGCSGDKVGAQAPEVTPSTTTESVAEPTETVEDYVDSMEVYGEMSVEEFESLPIDDRLKYAHFLQDITEYRGMYELIYGNGGPGEDYRIDYQEADLNDTNQTILNGHLYKLQISLIQPGGMENDRGLLNQDNAQKILSYAFYYVGDGLVTSGYKSQKEQNLNTKYLTYITNEPLTSAIESETKQGILTDRISGNDYVVTYRDIEASAEGQKVYIRFVFEKFSDYRHQNNDTWLLESVGSDFDNLNSNSTIK